MPRNTFEHETVDEKRFLRGIGSYQVEPHKHDKLELLKKYLEAMKHRDDWGSVSPSHIAMFCGKLIREEQQRRIELEEKGHE